MTILEQMKADAIKCNQRMRISTGFGSKGGFKCGQKDPEIDRRRKDVARLVGQGMTFLEVGDALGISHTTVSNDMKRNREVANAGQKP